MCKLYLGSTQDLEKKLFADIAAAKCDNPFYPVNVIVENNLTGVYLKRALADYGSYCRVRFLSLADMAAEMAEGMPDYAFRGSPPPFCEEWLASLASDGAAGGYFAPVAGRPGFRMALLQIFRELGDAGLERIPFPHGGDPRRIGELQRLFDRYRELRRSYSNKGDAFAAAAQAVPSEPHLLVLYGVYILSGLEKRLLASLAARMEILVYWQEPAAVLDIAGEVLRWYGEQGFSIEQLSPSFSSGSNLNRLQKNLFQPPSEVSLTPPVGDMSLEFICAPDETREVEEITREMIRLARSGVRFGEMAVLSPHFTYTDLISERLAAAGIPCYLPGGRPLARTSVGRSFLLLLEMLGGDYPRREVIEFLSHAPFDYCRLLGGAAINSHLWDYLTMQAGIIKGRRQWREALERYRRQIQHRIGEQTGADEAVIKSGLCSRLDAVNALYALLELLFDVLHNFAECRSWAELSAATGDFVLRFYCPGEERELLHRLMKILCRLDECGGRFSLKYALELIRSAVETTALPLGRFQQEGVNLLPLHSAAGFCFPIVFIPGLAEKIFPAPVSVDPLLPETERQALAGLFPLRRRKLEVDRLRFSLALGGARGKAILSWPRATAAGSKEQLPSFFLSCCGEALLGSRPGYEQLSRLPGFRYITASALEATLDEPITNVDYDLSCCRALPPPLQPLQYYRRLSPSTAVFFEADLERRQQRLGSYEGIFTEQGAPLGFLSARLAAKEGSLSATFLEDYARCPFSFFMKRFLNIVALEEPELLMSMEPLSRGRLVHVILEQFYRCAAAEGLLPLQRHPETCRALLKRITIEAFDGFPPEELPFHPLLRRLQLRSLDDTLQAFLDWEIETATEFMPLDFELRFGDPDSGCPVVLNLPSGEELRFRGRIDRVDRSGDRVRVIDYKTGRRRIKDDSLAGGEGLQLPLYLLAAGSIYSLPPEGGEAWAYHLSPAGVKTVHYSGESWLEKKPQLEETVGALYSGIAAGHFFPYPNPGCLFCDYRSLCGPQIERTFKRKATDPKLAAFLRIKEEMV